MPSSRKHGSDPHHTLPWSVPVAMEDVPDVGKHFDIAAPDTAMAEIAARADVRSVFSLSASLDLMRSAVGVRVTGVVRAEVEQACVVTLEPLHNRVEETVDLTFSDSTKDVRDVEVSPDVDGAEPAELMENGVIDLAAVAVEFLLIGIDPYPRKEGAEFGTAVVGNPEIEPPPHPFAALEALKRRDDGKDH